MCHIDFWSGELGQTSKRCILRSRQCLPQTGRKFSFRYCRDIFSNVVSYKEAAKATKKKISIWNFSFLQFCQEIAVARFRVEVLSFYLAANFSYVPYIYNHHFQNFSLPQKCYNFWTQLPYMLHPNAFPVYSTIRKYTTIRKDFAV